MNIDFKKCSKCGQEKPKEDYYKHKRRTDGLQSCCKVCKRKENDTWFKNGGKEVVKAYQRTPNFRASLKRYLTKEPPAVYAWVNKETGEVYVGSTKAPIQRKCQHATLLNANLHNNPYFEESLQRWGASCFDFKILEYCDEEELLKKESHWIKHFGPKAFNIMNNPYRN